MTEITRKYIVLIMQFQKAQKQLPNRLKGSRNKRRAICFMVSSVTSALILLPFLAVAHLNQVPFKTISWSVKIIQLMQLDCSNRTSVG